jgi:hypothetical protein
MAPQFGGSPHLRFNFNNLMLIITISMRGLLEMLFKKLDALLKHEDLLPY